MGKYKYTNSEIRSWAEDYLLKVSSLEKLEKEIGIPHATLWWCFTRRLPLFDPMLYRAVDAKLIENNTSIRNK